MGTFGSDMIFDISQSSGAIDPRPGACADASSRSSRRSEEPKVACQRKPAASLALSSTEQLHKEPFARIPLLSGQAATADVSIARSVALIVGFPLGTELPHHNATDLVKRIERFLETR